MKQLTVKVIAEVSDDVTVVEARRLIFDCLLKWPNDIIDPVIYDVILKDIPPTDPEGE